MLKSVAAAFVFFTRLPFWRLKAFQVPPEYFSRVVNYWAVVGWLTGGIMAATLWLTAQVLPYSIAVILALLSRVLLTGALHEDGLADFLDGFGGGNTKERILAIMKDSHIGTYGVIGLIFYFLLFYSLLVNLPYPFACFALLVGDPFCKFIASQLTRFLPYARTAESSKAKTIYKGSTLGALLLSILFGLLPLFLLFDTHLWLAALAPVVVFFFLILLMKKKIQGYTGDCCGALFLLCEISFYIAVLLLEPGFR
ncbi:adenosylcobinamide-GDP ribazoletransferase [Parabacteroides sp. PFB2-10]|uniref:adenosylcobinamide-GDP ribazoletransferase n=1 Tax=Parabacteroides sp. PFB2-10 TaxID=1742405 RepID=UPI002475B0D8|nr:adenosylcobinamide-GDP ribazoletransferase [Parabacteroides sp. PFB2-10]MDH6313719.1 adenosylcobinamide-GDP ribazoletransferase [Parabacteroides sp. PFB2-10]